MKCNRLLLTIYILFICSAKAAGQDIAATESLKKKLAVTKDASLRFSILEQLANQLMNINIDSSDKYGEQLIFLAETSRNREWMIRAYLANGERCYRFSGRTDFQVRSSAYYKKALAFAKQCKMPDWMGTSLLRLSRLALSQLDKDGALNYANEGASYIAQLDNDSLKAELDNTLGDVYLMRNNKTLALRYYLTALNKADDLHNHSLTMTGYLKLGEFYSSIEDYDRAIDYYTRANDEADRTKRTEDIRRKPALYTQIGSLYSAKKEQQLAEKFYQRSIAMADSLKDPALKVPAYINILNEYLNGKEPQKGLNYFNSEEGTVLKNYLSMAGFAPVIDQAYGAIYTQTGALDSARLYFRKAAPFFEHSISETNKIGFYFGLANLFKKSGQLDSAISQFLTIKSFADKNGLLETAATVAQELDTLYSQRGDFQTAKMYTGLYYQLQDSINKINKEKEMAQVEAADEQGRIVKLQKQEEEQQRRWHNIQYMGITIAIAAFFILLVLMGILKVSVTMIRILGFFGFIMFFEFLILIADTQIHAITHGEPWKVLGIKIILIAVLLPFHHWIERNTIEYLTSQNSLTMAGQHLRKLLSRKENKISTTKRG